MASSPEIEDLGAAVCLPHQNLLIPHAAAVDSRREIRTLGS